MSKAAWYWHRLRAMSPGEVLLHARKRWRQTVDARPRNWAELAHESTGSFPRLPKPEDAPESLREALRHDADEILAGRWLAFGHLELKVDDPPKWHCDYLVGRDLATPESAFTLDHRALPGGADIKLIWELSRWTHLTRLAMAAYVLGDQRAAEKCLAWLEDWVMHNPPYRGWNWTSALEAGLRLIQFTWIDALLGNLRFTIYDSRGANQTERLRQLRRAILPPHVWFTWRHRSFGSSANNHLLGELAGLIAATVRWPELNRLCTSLDNLHGRWEHEVLGQFAEDGGNREQALNYHLFSWELCWQTRAALTEAGRTIAPEVHERLLRAAQFFVEVQVPTDPWDYGDSDNAYVTPFSSEEHRSVAEWIQWFNSASDAGAIEFWLGVCPGLPQLAHRVTGVHLPGLTHLDISGQAVLRRDLWTLRVDASLLGYMKTAAHGHLDALHMGLWREGVALVIDPGTGAYYADQRLRGWLTSRAAHNCPSPLDAEWPRRLGPFLWAGKHALPEMAVEWNHFEVGVCLRDQIIERRVVPLETESGLLVEDRCLWNNESAEERDLLPFSVRWQFAPESRIETLDERRFRITRRGVAMEVQVSADWAEVFCVMEPNQVAQADPDAPLAGTVSPAFRRTIWAPYLKLIARPTPQPCVFSTEFLACGPSIPVDRA